MSPNGIVTLTTDYGTAGAYSGALRGAVLARARVQIVDITHEIPPQDLAEGARVMASACPVFPPGTVHVGVVDPGVGTARAAVVVAAGEHLFVGPDNGLFGDVVARLGLLGAWIIDTRSLGHVSATFHGRDVFAPIAARLATGTPPEDVGPPATVLMWLAAPSAVRDGSVLRGEVVAEDRFGNLLTNLRGTDLPSNPNVAVAGRTLVGLTRTYGDATSELIALIGSDGFLEVAAPNGSAARFLGAGVGRVVEVRG